jgi:hypothetical protein
MAEENQPAHTIRRFGHLDIAGPASPQSNVVDVDVQGRIDPSDRNNGFDILEFIC